MEMELLKKSREYIRAGKNEKAQIILRRTLNENPNQPQALELLGDLSVKLGNASEAIQRYDKASERYMSSNDYARAIICLEKIIRINKTNEEVIVRLADLYRFYGLPNTAIKTILDFSASALNTKQDAAFLSGLRKVIEFQPKNLGLRLSYSKVLLATDRRQDAVDELKKLKAMAQEMNDEEILGEIAKLLPQPDGGEELDPKSRIELGNLLYEIGSKDEAIVEFEKAVSDLIESGDNEDAITVLNRIMEIDPNNNKAIEKIKELQGEGGVETAPEEEVEEPEEAIEQAPSETNEGMEEKIVAETPAEKVEKETPAEAIETSKPEEKAETESTPEATEETAPAEETEKGGTEMFEDLGHDIEGFVPATESTETQEKEPPEEVVQEAPAETEDVTEEKADDMAHLEGQIADIEFLLKETEGISKPSFEISKEFDDFRNNIQWQEEESKKKLELAEMAFEADLYESALQHLSEIKDNSETWPRSLEIQGGSLIRLGRYSDAKKFLAGSLLSEEVPEKEKIELRYLLASAYEGLGDFDNAMREIERIISINPKYKDVRELYTLMGGKDMVIEEPSITPSKEKPRERREPEQEVEITPPAEKPAQPQPEPRPERKEEKIPQEPVYPTIVDEMPRHEETPEHPRSQEPSPPPSEHPKKPKKEVLPDEKVEGDNIAFL